MRILLGYDWPGNVRELKSAIEFATLHCKEPLIRGEDLPPEILYPNYAGSDDSDQPLDDKQRLLAALQSTKGNRTNAARRLGISRATLYRRLESLGLKPTKQELRTPKDVSSETPVRHPCDKTCLIPSLTCRPRTSPNTKITLKYQLVTRTPSALARF